MVGRTTALPINIHHFEVNKHDNGVHLKWTALIKSTNKVFIVYRAGADGAYAMLSEVAVNATGNYFFNDIKPRNGLNYYKIAQVDIVSGVTETEHLVVNYELSDSVEIFPNPIVDSFTVKSKKMLEEHYLLNITDLFGRILFSKLISGVEINDGYLINIGVSFPKIGFLKIISQRTGKTIAVRKLITS